MSKYDKLNIKPIIFQGVIDAAVNGGIAKYQEAFFTPTFIHEFPNHLFHVAKLQKLMLEQVSLAEYNLYKMTSFSWQGYDGSYNQ